MYKLLVRCVDGEVDEIGTFATAEAARARIDRLCRFSRDIRPDMFTIVTA